MEPKISIKFLKNKLKNDFAKAVTNGRLTISRIAMVVQLYTVYTAHSCTMNLTDKIKNQTKPPILIHFIYSWYVRPCMTWQESFALSVNLKDCEQSSSSGVEFC